WSIIGQIGIHRKEHGGRATSCGTRGSQVQIAPLRPVLSSPGNIKPDSFPDRILHGVAKVRRGAAERASDCRIDSAIIRLPKFNTVSAQSCQPTFGSEGSQETLPDDCVARVTS